MTHDRASAEALASAADSPRVQLVPDWETKRVLLVLPVEEMGAYDLLLPDLERCYAEFTRELARYEDVACFVPDTRRAERMARLSGLDPRYFPRASVPDIWIRDFAPICARGKCVQFRYAPPHVPAAASRDVARAMSALLVRIGVEARCDSIALAGGNLVHDGAGAGLATRAFVARNHGKAARERVRAALGLERLVLVPPEPGDRSGHVDGMIRFAAPGILLVNDYARLPGGAAFQKKIDHALERGLPETIRVTLPYRWSNGSSDAGPEARGTYANFLQTSQRVYAPHYSVPEDEEATQVFESLFPGRVSFVDAAPIARYGGSLHCITWSHV